MDNGSDKTVIKIMIQQPAPKKVKKEYCKPSLLEKVCEYKRRVEAKEINSDYEWEYLKRLYERVVKIPKLTKEQEEILSIVEELIEKFGGHESGSPAKIDGMTMNRYNKD